MSRALSTSLTAASFALAAALAAFLASGEASAQTAKQPNPVVLIETNLGTIEAELFADKAPVSTQNFIRYANEKFYDGTVFHRVIKGFMIQGGGYDAKYQRKSTHEPIKNEADNGLTNQKYTLAMARTSVVHSATAQFFINTVDNARLDHRSPDSRGFGYAVFGRVVKGKDVVDLIEKSSTGSCPGIDRDCPKQPVVITRVSLKETAKPPATP